MYCKLNLINSIGTLIVLVAAASALTGCAVVTRYETLRGTPSLDYSTLGHTGKFAQIHPQRNTSSYPYLTIGDTNIYFATIWLSQNVLAAGPLLPIIPILEEPESIGAEAQLEIKIYAWPEEDVISFYPNEFKVTANQSGSHLLPILLVEEKSYGFLKEPTAGKKIVTEDVSRMVTIRKERVDAASVWPKYTLVFNLRLKDVESFVLVPGVMHIGDDAYLLPDINYKRYSHTDYD